jgi:23S rRNA pseudouridine955/2504/2580 synthase
MNPRAPAPAAKLVTVDADQHGQRIDNFLARILKGVPKSHIYRVLRKGEVRVNKGRVKPEYRVQAGDQVRVPPVRVAERDTARVPDDLCQRLEAAILYEDGDVLVLDKPSGLAVHAGSGLRFGVIEALRQSRPQLSFLELVHRLDRETSGCLLLAKNRPALNALHDQLREGRMEKRYLALVSGHWQGGKRSVSAPLRKNTVRGGERMVAVDDSGKEARTHFTLVQNLGDAALVEALIDTGRTHQIRVHAAHIGHPLAGDDKYGDEDFNRRMRAHGLKRLFLHAQALAFQRPGGQGEIHVSAPLGEDLKQVLESLEQQQ